MSKLLNQFRSFYFRNYPDDMETQIDYFSIFGGLGLEVDTTQAIELLIQKHILDDIASLEQKIEQLTLNDPSTKRLLRALAIGDRRIFSAFNKAGLNNGNGGAILKYLQEKDIISIEHSRETPVRSSESNKKLKRSIARHRISHKVLFTQPFIRFWFYFIAPHLTEIQEENYAPFFKDFTQKHNAYTSLVFEELSEVLLHYHIRDAQVISSGSYWDANVEIDILTLTNNGSIHVGECKWTNHRVNKKELHKLQEKCDKLHIQDKQIILFSKRGFSKELENISSKDLLLYSASDFSVLLRHNS